VLHLSKKEHATPKETYDHQQFHQQDLTSFSPETNWNPTFSPQATSGAFWLEYPVFTYRESRFKAELCDSHGSSSAHGSQIDAACAFGFRGRPHFWLRTRAVMGMTRMQLRNEKLRSGEPVVWWSQTRRSLVVISLQNVASLLRFCCWISNGV